ncbi:hypothetical protein SNEBB_004964 [Seison nebaliae]|nr:hypothetical protein SNEBB_004964 [Seison nebaliae]
MKFLSTSIIFSFLYHFCVSLTEEVWRDLINLPPHHIPFFFHNNINIREKCLSDRNCPFKKECSINKCWGYEDNCPISNRLFMPVCENISTNFPTLSDPPNEFYDQADFGYVRTRQKTIKEICIVNNKTNELQSSLKCSQHGEICSGKNLMFDFVGAKIKLQDEFYRYGIMKMFMNCIDIDKQQLKVSEYHPFYLQTWVHEYQNIHLVKGLQQIEDYGCDMILKGRTIFVKLDIGTNMFHQFCDFVNLYASLHLWNIWSKNVRYILWDTSNRDYATFFGSVWTAFSSYPLEYLREFDEKRICIENAYFPLLSRMPSGLYYNMPLVDKCYHSSMIRSFSDFILHHFHITRTIRETKIRVTIINRETEFRRILNVDEIVEELNKYSSKLNVVVVTFNSSVNFQKQLQIIKNTDLLVGIHGAGLTHIFFLPKWAGVFELYDCEDSDCYKNIARISGIYYQSWKKKDKMSAEDEGHHPTMGAHKKYTNYIFDPITVRKTVMNFHKYIIEHEEYEKHQLLNSRLNDEL